MSPYPTIAVAGASGFVGKALIAALKENHRVVSLVRGSRSSTTHEDSRFCDFFSEASITHALEGIEVAYYLIHSMAPTARLDQSTFEDTDLLLARNFGTAAKRAGVKKIIYLGGLIPKQKVLSAHLRSRLEVESELASFGVSVITLRAGLVIGDQGSSFQLVYLLVKRLPVMICPGWTQTRSQPISIEDVVRLLVFAYVRRQELEGSYDVGGPQTLTYEDLMRACAKSLGLKRVFFRFPYFTPGLSTLWVCLITGASARLVAPLVKSLTYPMEVSNPRLLELYGIPLESAESVLSRVAKRARAMLRGLRQEQSRARKLEKTVRSIQRLTLPRSFSVREVASFYFDWLNQSLFGVIRAVPLDDGGYELRLFSKRGPVLICLLPNQGSSASDPESGVSFFIDSGLLVSKKRARENRGLFEFVSVMDQKKVLVVLQNFSPSLPWFIYVLTQAQTHLWVMRSFGRALLKHDHSLKQS